MEHFLDKVRTERRVLTLINSRFGNPELAGLNSQAVAAWTGSGSGERIEAVRILEKLGELVSGLSERSGQRDNDFNPEFASELEQLLVGLQ